MSANKNIRVAFILPEGHWTGGKNYLRNLFSAIRSLPENPITPVIFTGKRQIGTAADFPETEIVATSLLDRKSPSWFFRKVIAKVTSQDILLQRMLQQHHISILSHSFHLGKQTAVKTIGWIPDFQHVHLPEFFTPEECSRRDLEFLSLCENCDKVIVSSECARADLQTFSPEHAHKAELLRFVASPVPLADAVSLPELQKLYGFDGPYFLLPNQFWAHKNHRIVVSALQRLKQRNQSFLVLATGSTKDYRNPDFFSSLMQYVAECGVQDSFRVLGQIPFDHLCGLMRHATAFLNPSKFEGWSTSVEEAKSMGKQIVLSDISVHREQAPEQGYFFSPEDPDGLAEALIAAYNGYNSQQDASMQKAAAMRFPKRQQEFGEVYLAIARKVAGS